MLVRFRDADQITASFGDPLRPDEIAEITHCSPTHRRESGGTPVFPLDSGASAVDQGITLSRQDVLETPGLVRNHTSALPFREHASALATTAVNTITTWARDVHEHNPHLRPPTGTTRDATVWLVGLPNLLALHPAADELHADLTGLADQIRALDRRPDRVYSGPCGAPTDAGPCPGHLYAHARDGFVTCPACGAQHDVAERRAWMTDRALDTLVTAPVALGWARLLMDHVIPPGTWRSWLSWRRILAHGHDPFGRPVYRFGDVVDLVAEHLRRRHAA